MCNNDDAIHCFQEYNDTLLMTYLAMFTNCSRFALTSFTDEVPYSSIPYIVLCWKFHLC
jgi:hypothetical protein